MGQFSKPINYHRNLKTVDESYDRAKKLKGNTRQKSQVMGL
jgi:hypothetical protein